MEEVDDPVKRSSLPRWSRLAVPIAIFGLLAGALRSSGAATPRRARRRPRQPASRERTAGAPAGTNNVSDRQQGHDRRRGQGRDRRGGHPDVGNWTYSATDEIVNQFQKYVKDTYGADIKLNYVGSQQPSEYLTKLAADQKAGNPASFDVIAVEENYWADASQQGLVDDVLAVGPHPEPVAGPRRVQARADVDRLPVDGLPGHRLQQERRAP